MCRIAGIITHKRHSLKNYLRVRAMCESLAHGGPDDDGIFLDKSGRICLGHRRLAILDLSPAGHQPMSKEPENVWLSFNGEVYNFRELRSDLESNGYTFDTATDTEVVLKAYLHWGTSAFGRLEGMFAFAIADLRSDKTYLVRSQDGIKPVYYLKQGNDLIFASEVKAFKKCGFNIPEDRDWKIRFLAFGHIPEPFTTLEGVRMLTKGHFMEWDNQTGESETHAYSSYEYGAEITNYRNAMELVRESLRTSVQRHLVSDAPVGVFLSGGVDSSILTLLADQFKGKDLRALSVNFREAGFNEKRYQELIAAKISGQHTGLEISKEDFDASFQEIVNAMDQPTTDGINSWFISRCAKEQGLKTVLSGIGGDEYFGGYPSFARSSILRWLKKMPAALLRVTEILGSARFKRISYLSMKNPVGEYLFLRGCFTPGTIASVLGISKSKVLQVLEDFPVPTVLNRLRNENRISWFESNLYMQNQLLKDTDAMSMYHGIEIRAPFLDYQMVRNTLKIDPSIRFSRKLQKKLLIDAFADVLPEEIWNRSKMGFSFPLQDWMKECDIISDENHYSGRTSKKLIRLFKKDRLHWSAAFALYLVQRSTSPSIRKANQPVPKNQPVKELFWEPFQMIRTEKLLNYSLN